MLRLVLPETEIGYNQNTNEFIYAPEVVLELEHSLFAISKWEQKHHKTFITSQKDRSETIDYIRCMTLNEKEVPPETYLRLSDMYINEVNAYMDDSMSAIYWPKENASNRTKGDAMTSEVIYYWMVTLQIPFECQYWHLNRLLNLIRVCNVKNTPAKNIDRRAMASRNAELNRQRRKAHHSRG